MKHQWDSPYEWLYQKLDQETDLAWFRNVVRNLAGRLDSDQLQDIFEGEMQSDGYFEPYITWCCITCEAENENNPYLTNCPFCRRCGAEYDWVDLSEYLDWLEEEGRVQKG